MKSEASQAILVFDGYCGFCTRAIYFLRRQDRHHKLQFRASQEPGILEQTQLSSQEVKHAAWLIFGSQRLSGAEAINAALSITTDHPIFLWVYRLPIVREAQNAVYFWISRHRHWFHGVKPYCRLPQANCFESKKQ